MTQAGRVVISNHTEFDWKRTYCVSYQLAHWDFPKLIPKNSSIDCLVQWSRSPFRKAGSRAGCVYQFVGSSGAFFLGASSEDGLMNVYVEYEHLFNLGSRRIDLGWYRNGIMPFFIAGTSNSYVSTETLNLSPPSSRESSRRSSQELPPDVSSSSSPELLLSPNKLSKVLQKVFQTHACLSEPTKKFLTKELPSKSSDKNVAEKGATENAIENRETEKSATEKNATEKKVTKNKAESKQKDDFAFETFTAVFAVLILILFTFVWLNQHRLI